MSGQGTPPTPPARSTSWAPRVTSRGSPDWQTAARHRPATTRGKRIERASVFMVGSVRDDIALHGSQESQQLVLLGILDAGALERVAQPLDHEVHLRFGVLQPLVDFVHGIAGVLAAASSELAELLDDLLLPPIDLHALEGALGARGARGPFH